MTRSLALAGQPNALHCAQHDRVRMDSAGWPLSLGRGGPAGRCNGELAPCLVYQRRSHARIVVNDLAVEAIEAFVHVDCPARLDGLYRAALCAQLAGAAAFR